ncbi:MAG: hypothetical protein NVS9B15_20300 [Acidobacteriaceae bacterium]
MTGTPASASAETLHGKLFEMAPGTYKAIVAINHINGQVTLNGLAQAEASLRIQITCSPDPCGYSTIADQPTFLSTTPTVGAFSLSDGSASAYWVFTLKSPGSFVIDATTDAYAFGGSQLIPAGIGSVSIEYSAHVSSISAVPYSGS